MFIVNQKLKNDFAVSIAAALLVTVLAWSFGFQYLLIAHGASLSSVSDTLTDSRPGFSANHSIVYTNPSSTNAGETVLITFDPTSSLFGGIATVTSTDLSITGMTLVTTCSAGSNRVSLTGASATALTITVCAGNTVASGTKNIHVNNSKITNPTSTGSYIIRIGGTQVNSADTRVAIVTGVTVTAAVATVFTFTVAGLATSTTLLNNATTTGGSSSTVLSFGTLAPNTHAELGQQLTVTTNAGNGFAVTIHEDQPLTSSNGNFISQFKNGNAVATPAAWISPSSTLDQPWTYGHFGITSDDADLGAGQFGTSTPLYAGSFQSTSTLTIFSHTGPSDGTTQNKGAAKVAMRIEIGPLQAAANDYTDQLIYVATPTF